uniref:Uncharacterized protein n=1 Tax=Arundo donax TaxID=35708 RepID=A0A0A9F8E0_ARUDO
MPFLVHNVAEKEDVKSAYQQLFFSC